MLKNIGTVDRVIRALAAVVIAVLYSTGVISGAMAIVLGLVAVMFAVTSAVVWCPAYMPFGISTCPKPTGGAAPKA